MKRVVVSAPAKVNLSLRVGERRSDGMHTLETTLLALDLLDRVGVACDGTGSARGEVTVELAGSGPAWSEDVPLDETNLALRAARLVLALEGARLPSHVRIGLEKRIPSRAGLGGGSSDAAAVAFGLGLCLGFDPAGKDRARFEGSLAELGADVPFFLASAASGYGHGSGSGGSVRALPAPRTERVFCLLTPEVGAPTGSVYAALDELRSRGEVPERESFDPESFWSLPIDEARARLGNDLEPAALAAIDGLARVRAVLDDAGGAHFRLAGSGASFFGVFEGEEAARDFLGLPAMRRMSRDDGLRLASIAHPFGAGVRVERA